MNLEYCFVCLKPVIPITGESQVFDGYNLSDEDDHIIEDMNLGACHAKCIKESHLNNFWYVKTLALKKNEFFEVTQINENSQLLYRLYNQLFIVLNNDATHISFTLEELKNAKRSSEGLILSRGGEMNIQLDLVAGTQLCRMLKKKGKISLIEIFRELDIEDKILRPDFMENGVLMFETDHKHRTRCRNGWISGRAKYQVLVPTEAVLKVMEVTGV